jgi:GalNAc-alpha-(1->4)-GalNAc-alpha-(1->3)-diNAcBac-PP-undecaprenol alpha-1,4-N-acetyl-D-galactosaminyltransferase
VPAEKKVNKIVVVGPALKMGGMERATANIVNGFHAEGNDVALITLFDQPLFFKIDPDIRLITPSGFNQKKLNLWKTLRYLRKSILELNPEVVLVYNKFYSAITLLSLFFIGKYSVVISERSSPLYQWSRSVRLFNRIAFFLRPPQGIISQTSAAATFQKKYYASNIPLTVIWNIVRPVEEFPDVKREKIVLAVGRLNDSLKGFDRLIRAFSLVKDKGWRLLFAGGDENQDPVLDALISDLKLKSHIDFLGKVGNIDKVYARASMFVIPSRNEGFPNALCEAMSAGLPCISYDFVAGPSEIITHMNNGLLVPNDDIEGLADSMALLMDDESLRRRLGNEAKKIRATLGTTPIIKKHIDFFNEVNYG